VLGAVGTVAKGAEVGAGAVVAGELGCTMPTASTTALVVGGAVAAEATDSFAPIGEATSSTARFRNRAAATTTDPRTIVRVWTARMRIHGDNPGVVSIGAYTSPPQHDVWLTKLLDEE
jgi:hypothetical protein